MEILHFLSFIKFKRKFRAFKGSSAEKFWTPSRQRTFAEPPLNTLRWHNFNLQKLGKHTLSFPQGVPSAAGTPAVLQFPLPPGTSHHSFTQTCCKKWQVLSITGKRACSVSFRSSIIPPNRKRRDRSRDQHPKL